MRSPPTELTRIDGQPAVAILVTVGRRDGDLVLPLCAGRNVVARGRTYVEEPEPCILESAQWIIECNSPRAEVWDDYSTNQSVLVPAALTTAIDVSRYGPLLKRPDVEYIAHPNEPAERHRHALREGDILRTIYAAFQFHWIRAR